ncbi:MAG: hypothetical protein KDA27_28800, partial [Candidatus Eisenbacteria bacterium]|nr:hypothetical protein [Candidatus Eisenbacteria bacterium]
MRRLALFEYCRLASSISTLVFGIAGLAILAAIPNTACAGTEGSPAASVVGGAPASSDPPACV